MLQRVDHPIRQENPAKPNEPFVLFQRGGTNWSMRYTMDGRQIRKSLGTSDEREAHRLANEIWHEQNYRLKQGLSILQHSFTDVAEEFIKLIEAEAERKERSADHVTYWVPKIRRFLVGYFGVKPIDKITPPDIERYLEWRKTYWTSGPGSEIEKIRCEREDGRVFSRPAPRKIASVSTIKGEMVIIRSLFQQAVRWGYSQPIVIPAPQVRKRADNRRPGFTAEEYEKLLTAAIARISELQPKSKLINARDGRSWTMKIPPKNIMADRIRLWCYIEIMAHSGMRPTEAKNLTWANIIGFTETRDGPIKDKDVRLHVRGKGKHGTSVPLLGVIPALDMLWQLFESELEREPNDDDAVFSDSSGLPIGSFKKSFNELLKATGLEYDYRGVRRTPYSLRHFYISEMLIKGTSIYDVALNTRTSLEMIEKHYAHVATEQIKDRLRPCQSEW
ncbi:tyrosine-type recombinase/integrase [Rhizobium pusense]|uniref:Tyrosine-type recombinase/integrase n=1 Tax=Agrobacterium pusense TaxID=648995 RepID=A0A6H0ZKG1_9HYPH|nr:tyrosine-type recombinase/integrase [Agrobacterium pusense]MDH2091245.1 tyrosine-type recombinase/integrase [Agrobacterium pusense]QIX21306.1 tyrosine-type recombinase/integrase [Agrobacterium pusense]WCK23272.1 tyrosine-type recombinase/integrase [Agrobacterium pusense]